MMLLVGPQPGTRVDPTALEMFFDRSSDAVLLVNRVRKILAMNAAAKQMTGWGERDLGQITCRSFGCRDERGQPTCGENCLAQRCIEEGQTSQSRYLRISRADGSSLAAEATFVALSPNDRRGGTCMLMLKDVSLLEHLDRVVRRHEQEIAEKNMILRGVADHISVGWRATLLELRGGADILLQKQARELGDSGVAAVTRIVQGTQRIEATFAQLKSHIQAAMAHKD